jgi:hypothetical protein
MSNPLFTFDEVKREQCKASIMIEGLSGRGKTGLSLLLGYGLTNKNWSKVFHIDTENKSANLFDNIDCSAGGTFGKFKVGQLTKDIGYKPTNYTAFREAAKKAGAEVVIEDSISHAWQYSGGVLDIVAKAKTKSAHYAKDKYAAWGDEEVVAEKNELLQLIRDPDVHVITTVRVKEKMEYSTDSTGKTALVSLGELQIQQADLKYEPDLVLQMVKPGKVTDTGVIHPVAKVTKSRYAIFKLDEEYEFTPALIEQLRVYLEDGVNPKELLEQQRLEYVNAIKEQLDAKPNLKMIWKVLKKDAGFEETKLEDMPLNIIKGLFIKLTN